MTIQQQSFVKTRGRTGVRPGEDQRVTSSEPYFSVILCTYNRCNMALSTLASLRRQTLPYEQFEVIVVDNGSSDGTLSAVQTYVSGGLPQDRRASENWRVRCLTEPKNGLACARNTGLQAATGEIAVFLDDDTLVDPAFLEQLYKAYKSTGAAAIGARVELRWEATRPHWLAEELLGLLGYFAPSLTRTPLPETIHFSNCGFSVKIDALRSVGNFAPFLSKRLRAPTCMEVDDLCRRLRQEGYLLWYEPCAVVYHRVPAARLQRAFFVGRAYWQGRSEVLMQYADVEQCRGSAPFSLTQTLRVVAQELHEVARIALLHRPLLFLARKPMYEQLLAAMAQARHWGHIQQQVQLFEHAPATMSLPVVLLVRPSEKEAGLLLQGLLTQPLHCTERIADIPLAWLWRHRAHRRQPIAIVHFYRPGAFDLTPWQQQRLWLLLRLAQYLGLRIVTSDVGGWWQNKRSARFLARRAFERKLLYHSNVVLASTRQPDQLYPDKKLRRRVRCLPHPGFRGYYPAPLARDQAHRQLGLPQEAGTVYLCFAHMHTEAEIAHLIEAFFDVEAQARSLAEPAERPPQLLLAGTPGDKPLSMQALRRIEGNAAIHLCTSATEEEMPLYMGAAHAVVLPHLASPSAGCLETAMITLSYERTVIAPDLPRFSGMLPPHASVLYDPASRASLVEAMLTARSRKYTLTTKGAASLEAASGWQKYAQRLQEIYKGLLNY